MKSLFFISIIVLLNGCSRDSDSDSKSKEKKNNSVVYNLKGILIYNVTTEYEDCYYPSIYFILEIQNFTNNNVKLSLQKKQHYNDHVILPSDATLHCENTDTLPLKMILKQTIIKQDSSLLIHCFLKGYEVKGSLSQIEKELEKKIGSDFYISSSKLCDNKKIIFKPKGLIKNEYYLNSNKVDHKNEAQMNFGTIKNPIFKPYERIKFLIPK